jgi:uncharacterized membrane protein
MASPSASSSADAESTDSPTRPAADGDSHRAQSAADAWRQVAVQLGLIRAFAGHYLQAKLDAVRLSIRQMVIYAALCIIGLVALASVAVMMVVFLFQGIAGGFGELFGRLWLGELVTMAIFALSLTATSSMALGAIRNASRRRTVEKYETRDSQERIDYGTDVHESSTRA